MRAEPRQDLGSAPGDGAPYASEIRREFPLLWKIAVQFDFAERLGGCSDPLWAEVDAAMREIWMARTSRSEGVTDAVATPKDSSGGR